MRERLACVLWSTLSACVVTDSDAEDADSGITTAPVTTGATTLTTGLGTDGTSAATDAATSSSSGAASADTTTDGPKFDLAAIPDTEPMQCIQCGLTIASMQSGVFTVQGANVFATATLEGQVVYALGTAGTGRFIATRRQLAAVQRGQRLSAGALARGAPRPPTPRCYGSDGRPPTVRCSGPTRATAPASTSRRSTSGTRRSSPRTTTS